MSEDKARCTSCGRSFQHLALAPKAHCIYCGGKLAGPGLEHLELVEVDDEPGPDGAPAAARRPVRVLAGHGPSRWSQPVTWLHELAVLAMLLMAAGLALGLLVRHDPLLPPVVLRPLALALLPVFWLAGVSLRVGLELFAGPSRSVIVALPLLVPGLLLGLPSAIARTLARLHGAVFGIWGLAVVLIAFIAGTAWLQTRHDPLVGARAWLEAQPSSPRIDPGWTPATSGWSGRLTGEGEGGFSLNIEESDDGTWQGTLAWVQSGRVDPVRGVHLGNHLAFPYPGPPWIQRWWKRPTMLSTMEILVVADGQIEGRDLVFGHVLSGQRVWQRQAPSATTIAAVAGVQIEDDRPPSLDPPVVLRPVIQVDDDQIIVGRAFVLQPPAGGEPVILTAAGLFGPFGGLSKGLNPQMLPALMGDALFFDLLGGAMRARGAMRRPLSGARATQFSSDGPPDTSHDLVELALLPGHSLHPTTLRDEPIVAGLQLWLPVAPSSDQDQEESLLPGKVSGTWEHGFSVRFDATVVLDGQVGAPLLDGQGRVAGMLVGRDQGERGSSLGIAMPAPWIATRLQP